MIDKFYNFEGKEEGPVSVILGGVHGDEYCGVEALNNIIPNLEINSGEVWLGYANPRAIDASVRFVESNLNRMFAPDEFLSDYDIKSYEYDRAQQIKPILQSASALLDVHASFTPRSRPFAICEPNAIEIVNKLPVDLVVSGFDEVEPGGTDYYMNKIGQIGISVECGYLEDKDTKNLAINSITSFLKNRGHITSTSLEQEIEQEFIRMNFLYKTKTNFMLSKDFEDFEKLAQGQIIGKDGDDYVITESDCVIVFARNIPSANEEAFLLGKYTDGLV